MISSLTQIKEAEKRAEEYIENSQKDSAVMIKKAEEEAVDIVRESAQKAKNKADGMLKQACEKAESEAKNITLAGVKNSQDVEKSAQVHVEAASKTIVSQIIGK